MALRDCGDGRAGGPVKPGKYSSAGPFGHNLSGADLRVKRTNCRGSRCDRHGIGYPPLGRDRSCAGTCRHARGRSRWVRAHFLVDASRGPSKPRSRPGLLLCAPSPRPTRTRRSQHVHSGCITGAAGGVGGNRVRADSRTGAQALPHLNHGRSILHRSCTAAGAVCALAGARRSFTFRRSNTMKALPSLALAGLTTAAMAAFAALPRRRPKAKAPSPCASAR